MAHHRLTRDQVIWAFDGAVYKESKRRECECKSENAKCTAWPS